MRDFAGTLSGQDSWNSICSTIPDIETVFFYWKESNCLVITSASHLRALFHLCARFCKEPIWSTMGRIKLLGCMFPAWPVDGAISSLYMIFSKEPIWSTKGRIKLLGSLEPKDPTSRFEVHEVRHIPAC